MGRSGQRHGGRFGQRHRGHGDHHRADLAMVDDRRGVRAIGLSCAILLAAAAVEAAVTASSGSVALLGDTLHNAADALTAIPLWIAFRLGRRPPTRRFTYGMGRTEDLAGAAVTVLIALSAIAAVAAAVARLAHPQPVRHLAFVLGAALVAMTANEVVARHRIGVGRRIGSAALEADGLHARADAISSLLVVLAVAGAAVGARWADPVTGLLIALAIVAVLLQTVRTVGQRLLDAVDPSVADRIERVAAETPGVDAVSEVRARWAGHRLLASVRLTVDGRRTVHDAHEISEEVHHRLLHEMSNLSDAIIHVDPAGAMAGDPHRRTEHHRAGAVPPATVD